MGYQLIFYVGGGRFEYRTRELIVTEILQH